ncbi:hypothetical protein [uncultured Butyricimonas sp.]|jgi:hypothetical protein|uniref:hypothetical protein n=1 Tax=uncultured Butyricimonas sp. TaxID=1268785 RepID=UPI0026DBFB0D|nr:hypothetical protein [uncultured Butyricimonas sp.]
MGLGNRINEVLHGFVDVYPEIADFEDQENIPLPFAIYKMKQEGTKTKDSSSFGNYSVSVLLVCEGYDESLVMTGKVREALLSLQDRNTNVTFISSSVDFDDDDRAYVTEINFTIKTY